jgi:hypothetical protein
MIRHRPADIGVEIPSRRGAGQRHVVEGESPGPDSIGQVSQSIEGYPTVGSQLASSHRDHAARSEAQEVVPAGMERRLLSPGQDTQLRENPYDPLAAEHLGK